MQEDLDSKTTPKMQQDARRLLGLRDFPVKSDEEKRLLLGSAMRTNALNLIDTTTNPRRKREVKKGIVLETVEKKLLVDELLKNNPVVYIGSGTDIEYPLALGARNIVLVDPIFEQPEAIADIKQRIATIVGTQPAEADSVVRFDFDYGHGGEAVAVSLVAKPYHHDIQEGDYAISPDTGGIILYASQGPSYAVQLENDFWKTIAPNGFVLDDHVLWRRNQETGTPEALELGAS